MVRLPAFAGCGIGQGAASTIARCRGDYAACFCRSTRSSSLNAFQRIPAASLVACQARKAVATTGVDRCQQRIKPAVALSCSRGMSSFKGHFCLDNDSNSLRCNPRIVWAADTPCQAAGFRSEVKTAATKSHDGSLDDGGDDTDLEAMKKQLAETQAILRRFDERMHDLERKVQPELEALQAHGSF